MGNGIVRYSVRKVPGGREVIARKRSRRGTLYISESVVIIQGEKSRDEMRSEIAAVVVRMDGGATQ